MPKLSQAKSLRPKKTWWLVGVVLIMLFLLLQMPAVWVVKKMAPNSPYIQHVSGNLWQGAAIWQLPLTASPLSGSATWSWQPWQLFLGKLGAAMTIESGQSLLTGDVSLGKNSWQIKAFNGKITPETLADVVDWQLPKSPLQVNQVMIRHQSAKGDRAGGFTKADGNLSWAGGEMGYPSGGRTFQLSLPMVYANLSAEQKDNRPVLQFSLVNQQDKRLGELTLDNDNMVDVNLTQRLLETMPDYKGQAPKDTPVVSIRQPLRSSLGSGLGLGSGSAQ